MKYLSKFLWTHSWDIGTLVPNKLELLTLISNISVLPRFNLVHLKTIVSLVGHLLRPLVLFKLGPKRGFIKFRMCPDSGSFYNVLPLALVTKYQMILDTNHKGLSATDVNGGELDIKGVVKMIILVGDGSRKQVPFHCV